MKLSGLISTGILLVACAFTHPVKAAENIKIFDIKEILDCQTRFKDRVDYSRCLDRVISSYDRKLVSWQKNIEFKLKEVAAINGRRDAIIIFQVSNEEFEAYKKKNCNWQYLAMLPDVSSAAIINKECNIAMTAQRIEDLKEISAFEF